MSNIEGLTISKSEYELDNGQKGIIAIFMYTGPSNPTQILDRAVYDYVQETGFHELIDANLDNPWMRVVLSHINEVEQNAFEPEADSLSQHLQKANAKSA